ncbi:DUF3238 domain-containing protein [Peribacillus simplex]|uniref:DUF3238 domain-containing protein n=2 Tax=Peribacillus TaxID=2675229 RepID=A0AA90SYZ2_9BACI|nr:MULTISPECIES: DUF3238 domain-containing protein [Peribacillus]MDP1422073.1 DUF3238 domain-containing protein [Peribacillus simplex]MDP1454740.1 DUF3238 domain-containing protein [Peribacillus frigoritolerans]
MKKTLFSGLMLILALFFSVNDADAASKLNLDYETTKNSVQFNWNSDAPYYQLYSGKKLIWEGSANEYTQYNLKPKKQYKYYLIALNEDKQVIDQTELRVITKKDKAKDKSNEKQRKLDGVTIDAIINKDYVKVKWDENLPDADGIVELYRNEEFLGEFTGNEYIDKNIKPDKYYTYRVVGEAKRSKDEIKKSIDELESKGQEITNEMIEEASYEKFDLGKIVNTFSSEEMNTKSLVEAKTYAAAAALPQRYNFRYTTFIPDAIATIPGNPKSCPTFRGDNRSYSFSSTKYRTRTEVSAYFSGTSAGTASWVTRDVGQSARYNCDGTTDYRTQTSYTMSKVLLEATSSKVSWRVSHAVGDPFNIIGLEPPVIDYRYNASVSYDGDIHISGTHDQAPAHEMYAYIPNSGALLTIFKHSNKGLLYLAPPMPNAAIEFSIYN